MGTLKKHFIVVMGPQGSGKSTQSKRLAEFLGYEFISSGEVLRKLKDEQNPIGLKLSEYWVSGELVPDDLIEEILFPLFEEVDSEGVILDGYPRNINQLKSFLTLLEMKGWDLDYVFYLSVGDRECLARLQKRAGLENREDETDEAIRRRIEIYKQSTSPLLDEYRKLNKLRSIDGERSIDEIQQDLQEITSKLRLNNG